MGQWKVSTLIARDAKTGKWEVIEGPEHGRIAEHKAALKDWFAKGMKKGGKQYDRAAVIGGILKRRVLHIRDMEPTEPEREPTEQ